MEGQFVVLDKEKKVVAIVSDSEVIINDEYQVIFDRKEEYQFIDCGNGVIKVVKEKTPQDVLNQGEYYDGCCTKCGRINQLTLQRTAYYPRFCMYCGNKIVYFRTEDRD